MSESSQSNPASAAGPRFDSGTRIAEPFGLSAAGVRYAVYAIFFVSGACGLIYEILWTRMMTLVFGISVYAVGAVVTSFMGGLGLGSLIFGTYAERLRRPLKFYGILEICIGLFALVFPLIVKLLQPIFIGVHHLLYGGSYTLFSLGRFAVIFPVMLVPTILMGGTLPIISRFFVQRTTSIWRDVSFLYALNTIGATAGTFASGFILLEWLGMNGTTILAALLNIAVGGMAIYLDGSGVLDGSADILKEQTSAAPAGTPVEPKARRLKRPPSAATGAPLEAFIQPKWLYLAVALAGFVSLALQTLWFRMLTSYIMNSSYAFTGMLMIYLLGLSVGSWLLGLFVDRVRRHALILSILQFLIGIWALVSLPLLGVLPSIEKEVNRILPWNDWYEVVIMILAQTLTMLIAPTILMGMVFPLATRMVTRDVSGIGGGIGRIYGANTVGTTFGSFLGAFFLIPLLGVRNSVMLAGGCSLGIGLLLLWLSGTFALRVRFALAGFILVFFAILFVAMPDRMPLPPHIANSIGRELMYRDDVTDTVLVYDPKGPDGMPNKEMRDVYFADGRANGGIRTRVEDHYYGHLPMLLHPNPESVLSIGVCSGNTIGAITRHKRLKHVDAVELSRGVIEATQYIPTNYGIFHENKDPRLTLHIEDGRNFLLGTKNRYDVININPPYVQTSGVVFLYTREFLGLCKAKLNPGGLVSHFIEPGQMERDHQRMVLATFLSVFPHVAVFHGPRLYSWNIVASEEPIRPPIGRVLNLLGTESGLKEILAEDKLGNAGYFFSLMLMDTDAAAKFSQNARLITDNKTVLDYEAPRSRYAGFGYIPMLPGEKPAEKVDFVYQSEDGLHIRKPPGETDEGGYTSVAQLNQESVKSELIADWEGVDPKLRTVMTEDMAHYRELRKKALNMEYAIRKNASTQHGS